MGATPHGRICVLFLHFSFSSSDVGEGTGLVTVRMPWVIWGLAFWVRWQEAAVVEIEKIFLEARIKKPPLPNPLLLWGRRGGGPHRNLAASGNFGTAVRDDATGAYLSPSPREA
jgi:hypothetical protein